MKNSIRIKFLIILSAFAAGIVLFYIILNSVAFEAFHLYYKKDLLIKTYTTINSLYNENASDMAVRLDRLDINRSLNIAVLDGDTLVYGRVNRPNRQNPRQMWLNQSSPGILGRDSDVLHDDGKSVITRRYDRVLQSYHIVLTATLDNGYSLFIRTPIESITESVKITNRFILAVGAIALLIGAVIAFLLSRSLTKPILKLSAIAGEMAHLNFNVKYDVKGKDEINDLGKSINILSERLEETISDLKTANAELCRDIETKTRIDEMRREFFSNVSHELKTPISLIQGYAEGLSDNIAADEKSRNYYCDVIVDESRKMGDMVKKLMTLMQIESGQDPLTIRRFEITSMIRSIIEKNKIVLESKGIKVISNTAGRVFVWGDEFLVEDVLVNYFSNAINHAGGEKIVEFNVDNRGGVVRIEVFNTGDNIPEQDLDKIWQSFYKVDKARTREYGGSGIGLAVVSAIMKAMGKPYGVRNVIGGVKFYIELDSADAEQD
ncbi:MAG: Alkaline phosphatase synthesis sensor protein PhoR [Firmicutes bacterium ADurb.Bin193]|nr:MAG: Alkaline phosphatase synthesis sensor protein PhoR [Firmicutes bacterium ADurb.Bin193]